MRLSCRILNGCYSSYIYCKNIHSVPRIRKGDDEIDCGIFNKTGFFTTSFSYLTSQTVMWELYTFLKFIEPSRNSISVYLHFSHISTLMKYTEPCELQAPPATEQVQFRMTRHKKVLFYMWASLFSLSYIPHSAPIPTPHHFFHIYSFPLSPQSSYPETISSASHSGSRSRNPVFSPPEPRSRALQATLHSIRRF